MTNQHARHGTALNESHHTHGEDMSRTARPLATLAVIAAATLLSACGSSTPAETSTASSAANTTSNRAKAVTFAECMRTNGVGGFPDPDASGNLTIDAVANGSAVNTNSPAWSRAIGACKALEPSGFTGHARSAGQQQGALMFARCIRTNGVPDFPDPTPGAPLVDTNRIPSAAQPGGMSILNAAMHKCRAAAAAAGVSR